MQRKQNRDKDAVKDVPADNPTGTLHRLEQLTKRVIRASRRQDALRPQGAGQKSRRRDPQG